MRKSARTITMEISFLLVFLLLSIAVVGCGDSQEKIELEKARIALEKERLDLEKSRKEIDQNAEKERIEASRPWWEKELAKIKGTGKPITKEFRLAIEKGDAVDVKNHIDYGEDVNQKFGGRNTWWTPLWLASKHGHTLVAALLIQEGASTTSPGRSQGGYPIYVAISNGKGDADIIRLLLDKGADVNPRQTYLGTPLKLISENKDHPHAAEIVKVLKEYGGTY